jgi:hypothetical protein
VHHRSSGEANRILGGLLLGALLCLAGGCASPRAEVNLWPLLQYSRDSGRPYTEWRFLGPVLRLRRDADETIQAIHPLVHSTVDRKGETQVYFLWPLGRYLEDETSSRFWLLPFILQRATVEGDERRDSFLLFPLFYIASDEEDGTSAAFFLFYGDVKDILGRDRIRYALFPLFLWTEIGDRTSWQAPWPLVGGSWSEDSRSFKVLPIYGYSAKDGRYFRESFLWPFFHVQRNDLHAAVPTRLFFFFPFFGFQDGLGRSSVTFLWPLFVFANDELAGVRYNSAPWPIVVWGETPEWKRFRVWPFYGTYESEELRRRFYLWPLIWSTDESTEQYRKSTESVFPFWRDRVRETIPGGERAARRYVWPLYHSERKEDGTSSLLVPALTAAWLDLPGLNRLFPPLWTMYRRETDLQGGEAEALLGAIRHRWRGRSEVFSVPWLYSYAREEDGSWERSFLLGLFGVSGGGDGGAFHVLTLRLFRW